MLLRREQTRQQDCWAGSRWPSAAFPGWCRLSRPCASPCRSRRRTPIGPW